MSSIVTGGSGFIGSHLMDALPGAVNVDKKIGKDIMGEVAISHGDTVYHLAALADIVPSIDDPVSYYYTNVTGTLKILELARHAGVKRFIYAASSSCYGMNGGISGIIDCRYPYALTKYLGEQLVMHYAQVYGMSCISLRLFNVYGLRQRTTGSYGAMFGTFLAQIANGKPITIVGDGTQKRDFIHVSDVVRALIKAGESGKVGIYNVGTGNPISVNEIVATLSSIVGRDFAIERLPKRPGEPDVTCADISSTMQDLDWWPSVSIREGIRELLEHLDDWKDAPVWDAESIGKATEGWFRHLGGISA